MNKLLTKIVGAALGLSMTVGVGVAVASNQNVARPVHADGETDYITISVSSFSGLGQNNYGSGAERTGSETGNGKGDTINLGGHYLTTNNANTPSGASAGSKLQCQANNTTIYNTSALPGRLVSVVLTQSGTARAFSLYGGSSRLMESNNTSTGQTPSGTKITDVSNAATMTWNLPNNSSYTYFAIKKGANAGYVDSIVVTYELSSGTPTDTVQSVSITGAPASTVSNVNVGTTGPSLTATATMRTGSATPTWTWASDNEDAVKVSDEGQLSYVGNGTAHISATASLPAGDQTGDSNVGSVTVTTSNLKGSSSNPFSVSEALAVASATGETATTYNCYTSGVVSRIKTDETYSSQYGNKIFWISADGSTTNEIEAFHCLYLNNQKMTEDQFNSIEANDNVTIVGKLVNYNSDTPEYTSGCYLTAHTKPVLPRVHITESSQSLLAGETLTLHYTTENPVQGSSVKWASGTPAVATIGESTGVVTAISGGTTSITAKMVDSNDDVVATSAAITITVVEPLLSDGDKFEIYYGEVGSEVYFTGISSNIGSHGTDEEEAIVFTAIESETSGQFALSFGDQYLSYSGSENKIYSSSTNNSDATLWTAENNGTYDVIESVNVAGRRIRYNTNSGQERFCCYANTSNIHIRKIVVADPTVLTMDTKTLSLEAEEVSDALTFTTDSQGAAFHWHSEDTSKATVANGVVTAGTTTDVSVKIYVYFDSDGSGDFDPAKDLNDYCTVTIVAPSIDYTTHTFGGTGVKITSSNASTYLANGKKIIMTYNDEVVAGAYGSFIPATSTSVTFDSDAVTIGTGTTEVSITVLELETATGGFYLKTKDGKYLSNSSTSSKTGDFTKTDSASTIWSVTSDGIYDIDNQARATIRYNTGASPTRFKTYTPGTGAAIVLYSFNEYVDEAETYADLFLESSLCGSNDNTKASASIWGDLKDTFNDDLSTGAQNVLKTATANKDSTDSIQKCLAKYDRVIYLHYGAEPLAYPDFMNRVANNYVTPLSNPRVASSSQTTNVAAIVAIVSVITLSAVAGYFMLRKRKEQ